MKKFILPMIILAALIITSCENNPKPEDQNTGDKQMTVNESEPSEFSAQGKIIKIDENGIHVQDGDKVDVYNVDPERTRGLFIGEYVGINKLDGDKYDVVREENHDYNTLITSEGKSVKRISGTVGEVENAFITATTEAGEIKLSKTGDFDLKTGDQFMADYVELSGSNEVISYYDEASKITVTAKEISRDNNGMMRIYAVSDSNVEYDIIVRADTVTNFKHSSLEPNDRINIYPYNVSGDVPAAVDAKLIMLNHDEDSID